MAGTTTKGLRFPQAGDNPAVHTDFLNLATDVDTELDNYILASAPSFTSTVTLGAGADIIFEGSTPDGNETTLTVTDPTADRTITLPDLTGTVMLRDATETISNKTLGSNLAAGSNKITGLGDASEATDTDAVNVKTALNLARTQMLLLGGM
jgi:hypothetical protein